MGINISGSLLEYNNSGIRITHNSLVGVDTNASGFVSHTNKPNFFAYRSTAGETFSGWNYMTLNTTLSNVGSCFNTSTGYFTAPVTGIYYFTYCAYGYKYAATSDSYVHPLLAVNGSTVVRKASNTTDYRLRARTYYASTYAFDLQINDALYLTAADFVQPYLYFGQTGLLYHQQLTGFYVE